MSSPRTFAAVCAQAQRPRGTSRAVRNRSQSPNRKEGVTSSQVVEAPTSSRMHSLRERLREVQEDLSKEIEERRTLQANLLKRMEAAGVNARPSATRARQPVVPPPPRPEPTTTRPGDGESMQRPSDIMRATKELLNSETVTSVLGAAARKPSKAPPGRAGMRVRLAPARPTKAPEKTGDAAITAFKAISISKAPPKAPRSPPPAPRPTPKERITPEAFLEPLPDLTERKEKKDREPKKEPKDDPPPEPEPAPRPAPKNVVAPVERKKPAATLTFQPAPPAPPPPPKVVEPVVVEPAQVEPAPPPPPPPPVAREVLNLVFVGSECAPWSKTGGLGDVMGALPKAMARRGHRVMVVVPKYDSDKYQGLKYTGVNHTYRVFNNQHTVGYHTLHKDGVDYVFVDHYAYQGLGNNIYQGSREDLQFRCALMVKAALEAPWHVPLGPDMRTYGEENLVYVANDWHTGLLPFYLQAHYRDHGKLQGARSMFVIHNIAHQGRGPMADLERLDTPEHYNHVFCLDDPIGGIHMNIMKAGLEFSNQVVAVSGGYAWEIQTQEGGWGLDSILRNQQHKLSGIVNGIDQMEWSPENDVHLDGDGYTRYSFDTLETGKAKCKAALQRQMGLPVDPNAPLLGFIGRLDYQKGVDLIRDNYDWIMSQGCQLIMLGSGREDLEQDLRNMEERNKNQCRAWVGFSVEMAHRITAGCDILLMPSRFEPCGLNQLYAMRYGTVPLVHAVGGLRDTVEPFNPFENKGTGWAFERAETEPFKTAMDHALVTYREYRDSFWGIQKRGMQQDLSWDNAAEQYEDTLIKCKYS
ncbi:unnamed protein product [Pedinophyceae sp. YPF-701]|nr:unnamed protein product [Pedinophyceae sp. YPF-701]